MVVLPGVAITRSLRIRLLGGGSLRARLWPESGAVSPIPALDGLRGVAVLLVLVFHAWYYAPGVATAIAGYEYLYPMNYLSTGVQLFFVLSGFLLFLPYARWLFGLQPRPSTLLFYKRRALRVGPAYWMSLVILALGVPLALPAVGSLVVHALFLHNVVMFTAYPFNPVYWTMAVEVQFYVALPAIAAAIAALARRLRLAPAVALVLGGLTLVSLVCSALNGHEQLKRIPIVSTALIEKYGLPFWLSVFAAGIACSLAYTYVTQVARVSAEQRRRLGTGSALAFAAAVLLAVAVAGVSTLHNLPAKSQVFGWLYAAMLLGALFGPARLRAPFESWPLRFVGLISYSLYLWHVVVLFVVTPHLSALPGLPSQTLVALALDVLIAVPLAYLSFQLTERPFFQARKHAHETAADPQRRVQVDDPAVALTSHAYDTERRAAPAAPVGEDLSGLKV